MDGTLQPDAAGSGVRSALGTINGRYCHHVEDPKQGMMNLWLVLLRAGHRSFFDPGSSLNACQASRKLEDSVSPPTQYYSLADMVHDMIRCLG